MSLIFEKESFAIRGAVFEVYLPLTVEPSFPLP